MNTRQRVEGDNGTTSSLLRICYVRLFNSSGAVHLLLGSDPLTPEPHQIPIFERLSGQVFLGLAYPPLIHLPLISFLQPCCSPLHLF